MLPPDLKLSGKRAIISNMVEGRSFVTFITVLILVNAVTLGLETDKAMMEAYATYLYWIDKVILGIFTIELALKLYAYRLSFFRSGWNNFDLTIVAIAWIPASGTLAVLRAFRILRILKLISIVPQMRRVVSAIGHSIPGMISIVGVMALIFYVASVLATKLFGEHPDANMQEWFGSISSSSYTLFQIMTLESWSMGVVRPTMDIFPWAWMFFLPFIIITSFAVLNFFIGIIVDSMQMAQKLEAKESGMDDDMPMTQKDYRVLLERMDQLQKQMEFLNLNK